MNLAFKAIDHLENARNKIPYSILVKATIKYFFNYICKKHSL